MVTSSREYLVKTISLLTLGLLGLGSFMPLESLWGFNHLRFLPDWSVWIYWLVVALALYLTLGPFPAPAVDRVIASVDRWLFAERRWPRFVLAGSCALLFYLFRVEAHLLGDGYAWLAEFGRGEAYIHKLTEPGSIYAVRWLQSLMDGHSETTALAAFQFLSILSGAVVIYTIPDILRRLCVDARVRLLGLVTVLFSGVMLLFFGYVEFYPISWAASVLFIRSAIQHQQERRRLWLVVLLWLLALAMHFQALYFLPALGYMVVWALREGKWRRIGYAALAVCAVGGTLVMIWLYQTRVDFEILFLPLLEPRSVAPGYAVISWRHALDLLNETLIVLPGFIIMGVLWLTRRRRIRWDSVSVFFLFLSGGSLLFMALFGAAITMGRDWDIFSLSLLPPLLFVLYQLGRNANNLSPRVLSIYFIVIALATVSFLTVNAKTELTEARFYTLLNDHNRSSWMVYANHFLQKGDSDRYRQITMEANRRYPDYARLQEIYDLLSRDEFAKALEIAEGLVQHDPYNADFLQVRGFMAGRFKRYYEAEEYYNRALRLRPYHSEMMNELGQLYMQQGKFDEAAKILKRAHSLKPEPTFIVESLALVYIRMQDLETAESYADTLFAADGNSPGGHLIKMTVALNRGDQPTARHHFAKYLIYGKGRSDYQNILEHYGYLAD